MNENEKEKIILLFDAIFVSSTVLIINSFLIITVVPYIIISLFATSIIFASTVYMIQNGTVQMKSGAVMFMAILSFINLAVTLFFTSGMIDAFIVSSPGGDIAFILFLIFKDLCLAIPFLFTILMLTRVKNNLKESCE